MLTRRIAALSKFLSRSAQLSPFFKILRKQQEFHWDDEYKKAFQEPKEFLAIPLILTKLNHGEPLFVYLLVTENVVSAMLIQEKEKHQKLVYFVNKVLHRPELMY